MFSRKLEEVGRVLFLISLTQRMPTMHKQSHVSLLQEDLLRLPSFPRTAIDAEFTLFNEPLGISSKMISCIHIMTKCLSTPNQYTRTWVFHRQSCKREMG